MQGSSPGVIHIRATSLDCPQFISVFSYQGRAWEQGWVIVCNWAKLPLIRWIEKRPVPQKGTSLQFPLSPIPSPGALKSVPDEGFPVGIRCSCSTANQTRWKKKCNRMFERQFDLAPFSSLSKTEWSFLVWVLLRNSCLRWRGRQDNIQGQFDSSTAAPPLFRMAFGG